eukprot:5742264-Prymnesium_polylepis.2
MLIPANASSPPRGRSVACHVQTRKSEKAAQPPPAVAGPRPRLRGAKPAYLGGFRPSSIVVQKTEIGDARSERSSGEPGL